MPHKNLNDLDFFTNFVVLLAGIWGAFMNYFSRKLEKYTLIKRILLFLFDMISSAGIAIMVYLLVMGYYDNELLAVGLAGFFAHLGTRTFYILEQIITQKLGVKL